MLDLRAIQPRHGEIEDAEIGLEVWHGVRRLDSGGALTNRVADFRQDSRQDDPDGMHRLGPVAIARRRVRSTFEFHRSFRGSS